MPEVERYDVGHTGEFAVEDGPYVRYEDFRAALQAVETHRNVLRGMQREAEAAAQTERVRAEQAEKQLAELKSAAVWLADLTTQLAAGRSVRNLDEAISGVKRFAAYQPDTASEGCGG